ncbi:alpha/beta hydrolase [Sphingomonas sp. Y38-1Y]|uniref:alpha/beta hydrolase n=1 Tax=Sphingomonas sp. Y38-1Y TaxID=3078265 RepID=UPI0028EFF6EA|nr:alpha/beta hydrolase fold domain-containing protein [Sphingomonas sp. Y38-1Y]
MTAAPLFVPMPPPEEREAIALHPASPRRDMPAPGWFMLGGKMTVRNVDEATLTPVLPDRPHGGAAVVIAAGGGYLIQAMENEAWAQARWLADRGVAAFVLKYRLEPTPAADDAFAAALIERFTKAADPQARRAMAVPGPMVEDAAAAMQLVRSRAVDWAVDPERIGYLGFSAGAMIGLDLVGRAAADTRPAFLATIYPSMARIAVAADPPPLFAAMAADDPLYSTQGYGLVEGWREAGGSTELHVYAGGGHGFGMGKPGTTSTGIMPAFHAWLESGGWLDAKGGEDLT